MEAERQFISSSLLFTSSHALHLSVDKWKELEICHIQSLELILMGNVI